MHAVHIVNYSLLIKRKNSFAHYYTTLLRILLLCFRKSWHVMLETVAQNARSHYFVVHSFYRTIRSAMAFRIDMRQFQNRPSHPNKKKRSFVFSINLKMYTTTKRKSTHGRIQSTPFQFIIYRLSLHYTV